MFAYFITQISGPHCMYLEEVHYWQTVLFLKEHENKIASDQNYVVAVVVVAAAAGVVAVVAGGGGGVVVDSAVAVVAAVDIRCPRCEMMGWMDLWPNKGAYLELTTLQPEQTSTVDLTVRASTKNC